MLAGVIAHMAEVLGVRRRKPVALATLALEIALLAALCVAGTLLQPRLDRATREHPGTVVAGVRNAADPRRALWRAARRCTASCCAAACAN